jgi:hypothetical protein
MRYILVVDADWNDRFTLSMLLQRFGYTVGARAAPTNADLRAVVLYLVTFEQGPFREPGMGMKFVDVRPEDSALIRFFINEQLGGVFAARAGPGVSRGQGTGPVREDIPLS